MEQRISLITLGVADLARACGFYEALGWTVGNDWRTQGVAFFQCGSMVLGLWGRKQLAADSGTQPYPPGAATEWGGYSAAFLDPDGHPWEIAHNPGWRLGSDGSTNLE